MIHQSAERLLKVLSAYAPKTELSDWERLKAILSSNTSSNFGQQHAFDQIRSIEAYRTAVPIRDYDELYPWIQPSLHGQSGFLTSEPIIAFERTSGSSGAVKWIPYTESLRQDFASALSEWLEGLRRHEPSALEGKAYWALSPRLKSASSTPRATGIESDGDYFPTEVGQALLDWLVLPPAASVENDADHFLEQTLDALLQEPTLSFISVWSPTFFLELDNRLRRRGLTDSTWKEIWPRLALVSCWADAGSARWASEVRARSGVRVEPKGLLSTEGIISIPRGIGRAPCLFRGGHFIEFVSPEPQKVYCRNELTIGTVYAIVLTTSGGLYRYRTGDLIEVIGIEEKETIQIRFIGRSGIFSDLVGEKLDECFVASVFSEAKVSGFLTVSGELEYTLWLADTEAAYRVIGGLRENLYFAQALNLGQLKPIKTRLLATGWERCYTDRIARLQGCRVGDVKLPILLASPLSGDLIECLT